MVLWDSGPPANDEDNNGHTKERSARNSAPGLIFHDRGKGSVSERAAGQPGTVWLTAWCNVPNLEARVGRANSMPICIQRRVAAPLQRLSTVRRPHSEQACYNCTLVLGAESEALPAPATLFSRVTFHVHFRGAVGLQLARCDSRMCRSKTHTPQQ